jgi:hypothetical protein
MVQEAEQYRELARQCELRLEKEPDLLVRQQIRQERRDWLELAANRDAVERASFAGDVPLDHDMTPASLRAFEAVTRLRRDPEGDA